MRFSYYISKRFTSAKKDNRFLTVISYISIAGVMLGVATLIIALSILSGFEKILTDTIIDFDSHIQITSYTSILPDYNKIQPLIESKLEPYVRSISPYASKLGIISSKKRKEGVNIKGINPDDESLNIRSNISEGSFDLQDNNILIGRKLADKLQVKTGDKLTIFALKNDELPSIENFPAIERFVVSGIFESGMAEYDDMFAYINLKSAQNLFDIGNNITGYDIMINDVSKIDSLTSVLDNYLRYPHSVHSIFQIHKNIFSWIDLQKKPIPIILGLIIIVAVLNIIGTLLMLVLEKTSNIGILKSMGATNVQVTGIFLLQGIFLTSMGIISGNVLAFTLLKLQEEFKIISLPSSVYFMSSVPVDMHLWIYSIVSGITLLLGLLAAGIPGLVASKIRPVSILRFG